MGITDDQIGDLIVKRLPEGVRLTAVMDCCHSGTGLDLPYTLTRRGWKEETNPFHSMGDVQLFSGCEDHDTSADTCSRYGAAGGAMTTALCDVLRQSRGLTYSELIAQLNRLMRLALWVRGGTYRVDQAVRVCVKFECTCASNASARNTHGVLQMYSFGRAPLSVDETLV